MDITITKPQKKILLYVVIGTIIILLFWGFIYLPGRKEVQKFQLQLDEVNKQLNSVKKIEEIKKAMSKGYTFTQSIESLKNELATLSKSIDTEEETPLKYISGSARELNLEIVSIKPSAKELLLDKDKNRVKIAGADCFRLPVELKLKGGYKAIADYLEILRKDSPSLIAIENLNISKPGKQEILTADVNLTIYLKSTKR